MESFFMSSDKPLGSATALLVLYIVWYQNLQLNHSKLCVCHGPCSEKVAHSCLIDNWFHGTVSEVTFFDSKLCMVIL